MRKESMGLGLTCTVHSVRTSGPTSLLVVAMMVG